MIDRELVVASGLFNEAFYVKQFPERLGRNRTSRRADLYGGPNSTDVAGKRVDILRSAAPGVRRLAILANGALGNAWLEIAEIGTAARTLGLEVETFDVRKVEDIAPAFAALKSRADALYVYGEPLTNTNRAPLQTKLFDRARNRTHEKKLDRALGEVEMLLASAPGALAWFLFNPLPPMTLTGDSELVRRTDSIRVLSNISGRASCVRWR
jgi:ABC transporter substrate binding protein